MTITAEETASCLAFRQGGSIGRTDDAVARVAQRHNEELRFVDSMEAERARVLGESASALGGRGAGRGARALSNAKSPPRSGAGRAAALSTTNGPLLDDVGRGEPEEAEWSTTGEGRWTIACPASGGGPDGPSAIATSRACRCERQPLFRGSSAPGGAPPRTLPCRAHEPSTTKELSGQLPAELVSIERRRVAVRELRGAPRLWCACVLDIRRLFFTAVACR